MKNLTVIVAAFFALFLTSCNKEELRGPKPNCGPNMVAVWQTDPTCGCGYWDCVPVNNPCNTCNTPPPCTTCNPDTNNGGGGTVTYNFNGSAYTRALLTGSATEAAYAFKQGTMDYVLENSGNKMTSPKLYVLSINPWNGTNFMPGPNDGQALIKNQGTSQSQGLYNRMVSEINSVAGAVAFANAVTYLNTGIPNANFYYVIVTLRKNTDGLPVGETTSGTDVFYEITGYEIVTGNSYYFQ